MSLVKARRITRRDKKGEVQHLFELPPLERRPKEAADTGQNGVPVDRLREEMALFRDMFEQFLLFRLGNQEQREPAPKKVWTPRSEEPLEGLYRRRLFPVNIVRGRVEFACPACQRPTELAAEQAGQKARCALCHSAIIVPRPGRSERGMNMERDVESLLHPERYQAQPIQGWAAVRRKHFKQVRILASLSMVIVFLLLNGYRKLQGGRLEPFNQIIVSVDPSAVPHDNQAAAEEIVRAYLAADGCRAKGAFVRDPERVVPLMTDYFARHPGSVPVPWKSVQAKGTGFYAGTELTYPITNVGVDTVAGAYLEFTVEHTPQGPRIEWESSLGYSPQEWPEVIASGAKAAPLRVMAALDDYYNFDYADEKGQICVRLQDPENNELLGYGYLDRKNPAAAELRQMLDSASPEAPRPVTIQVAANEHSQDTKQVRIVKLVGDGWRSAQPTMASAQ